MRRSRRFEHLPENWSWWGGHFATTRQEVLAVTGSPEYGEAHSAAQAMAGDSRYLTAILMRADGIHDADDELIRKSATILDGCGARYQAARSRWLLGGFGARGGAAGLRVAARGDARAGARPPRPGR